MFRILPRDQRFFILFEKAARNTLDGAEILKELLDGFEDVKEKACRIEIVKSARELHRGISRLSTKMEEVCEHCVEVNSLPSTGSAP